MAHYRKRGQIYGSGGPGLAHDHLEHTKDHATILRNQYFVGIVWYVPAKLRLAKNEFQERISKLDYARMSSKVLGTWGCVGASLKEIESRRTRERRVD